MKTRWFTFGQIHEHIVDGRLFDKDTVVEITAENPREVMVKTFGRKWCGEYTQPPQSDLFPKGIVKL